jgi:hypothetical protein
MILIESNSVTCGVQDRIFILRVLFDLVTTLSSRPEDGAAESVLVVDA